MSSPSSQHYQQQQQQQQQQQLQGSEQLLAYNNLSFPSNNMPPVHSNSFSVPTTAIADATCTDPTAATSASLVDVEPWMEENSSNSSISAAKMYDYGGSGNHPQQGSNSNVYNDDINNYGSSLDMMPAAARRIGKHKRARSLSDPGSASLLSAAAAAAAAATQASLPSYYLDIQQEDDSSFPIVPCCRATRIAAGGESLSSSLSCKEEAANVVLVGEQQQHGLESGWLQHSTPQRRVAGDNNNIMMEDDSPLPLRATATVKPPSWQMFRQKMSYLQQQPAESKRAKFIQSRRPARHSESDVDRRNPAQQQQQQHRLGATFTTTTSCAGELLEDPVLWRTPSMVTPPPPENRKAQQQQQQDQEVEDDEQSLMRGRRHGATQRNVHFDSKTMLQVQEVEKLTEEMHLLWYSRRDLGEIKRSAKLQALGQAAGKETLETALDRAYIFRASQEDVLAAAEDEQQQQDIGQDATTTTSLAPKDPSVQKALQLQESTLFAEQRGLERWTSKRHALFRCMTVTQVKTEVFMEQMNQMLTGKRDPAKLAALYQKANQPAVRFARVLALTDALSTQQLLQQQQQSQQQSAPLQQQSEQNMAVSPPPTSTTTTDMAQQQRN